MKPIAAWSYSRLALYEECPAKYKYRNIDKLEEPKAPAMFRGIKVHNEAAAFLDGSTDIVPDSCKQFEDQFYELRDLDAKVEAYIIEKKWAFTKDWKKTTWMKSNVRVRITLDVGLVYGDGHAEVIDHKTGKYYPDGAYDDQLALFAASLVMQYTDIETITARLWYLDEGKEIIREFTAAEVLEILADLEDRADVLMSTQSFPPRANRFCGWCHFRKGNGGPCKFGA